MPTASITTADDTTVDARDANKDEASAAIQPDPGTTLGPMAGPGVTDTKATGTKDAGLLARWLTLLVCRANRHWPLKRQSRRVGIPTFFNLCIKVYPFPNIAEAHAMQFVAKHTSIPVPKVHCAFIHKRVTYIVMDRIEGHQARYRWPERSPESKMKILEQLRRIVAELRSIPPSKGPMKIGNVDGGPLIDPRLPSNGNIENGGIGPFATKRAFHDALVFNANHDGGDLSNLSADLGELLRFYRRDGVDEPIRDGDLVFTHGDLSSLNILVRGDEVVGIVDWETAGWFPAYWEYVCAKHVNPYNTFWKDEVDHFITPMPLELEMDTIRLNHFEY